MKKPYVRSIQITRMAEEEHFPVQLKITFASGEIKYLDFKPDSYTFEHLRRIVFPAPLQNWGNRAACYVPVRFDSHMPEAERIIWKVFGQSGMFSYACSREYKLFINNLRSLQSEEEFEVLVKEYLNIREDRLPVPEVLQPDYDPPYRKAWKLAPATLALILLIFGTTPAPISGGQQNEVLETKTEMIIEETGLPSLPPLVTDSFIPEQEELPASKEIIKSLPEGQVALTFDDGPSAYTEEILSVLKEHNVPATFFFIGQNIPRFPQGVAAAWEQGHAVGLHSFSHRLLRGLSPEQQEKEIDSCLEAIKPYVPGVSLFRPPYGSFDDHTRSILLEHNMSLVLWNRDPRDWNARSALDIIDAVFETVPSGGIYVLHENALTLEALPQIITRIKEMGLDFVHLGHGETNNSGV